MNTHLFHQAAELQDDDRYDPFEAETPEPCRGCGSIHCDSECAAYREWLTVAWLEVDTADREWAGGEGAA